MVTLQRGFPSLSEAEDYPVRLYLRRRVWVPGSTICSAAAASNFMIYEGVEFVIRAGLGRHQWTLLISYPTTSTAVLTVSQFSGSMAMRPRSRVDAAIYPSAFSSPAVA